MNYPSVVISPGMSREELVEAANRIMDWIHLSNTAKLEMERTLQAWIEDSSLSYCLVDHAQSLYEFLRDEATRFEEIWDAAWETGGYGDEFVWMVASESGGPVNPNEVCPFDSLCPSEPQPGQLPFQHEAAPVENLEELLQEMLGE